MLKCNKETIIYIALVYILMLQPCLQEAISIFQYVDEILTIVLLFCAILKLKNDKKISKINLIMIIALLIIFILGIVANFIYEYQEFRYIISDILVFYKFYIIYFTFESLFKKKIDKDSSIVYTNIKFITIILGILTILNYIFDIFPSIEERFGIKSNQLFFGHPTNMVSICVFLLGNVYIFGKNKKGKYFLTFILLMLISSTLRMKAIAFVAIAFLIIIYVNKIKGKINFGKILILGLICIIIGFDQIKFYFIDNNETARDALFSTSFKIANDYFPLGTGFATFGSFFSGENYSPVYQMYNIDTVWGLGASRPAYISDSFWPMVLGQFGYIGLALYVACIAMIFIKIQKSYKDENKNIYLAKILVLLYLIISSTAESAFVNPLAIPLAIILAL